MKAELTGGYLVAEGLDDYVYGEASFEEHDDWFEYLYWDRSFSEYEWDMTGAELAEVMFGESQESYLLRVSV